jgi:hypothetical protein
MVMVHPPDDGEAALPYAVSRHLLRYEMITRQKTKMIRSQSSAETIGWLNESKKGYRKENQKVELR